MPAGGIQKWSSHHVPASSRTLEPLYAPCTYIPQLDDEQWTAPKSAISAYFEKPLENVKNPLAHWYDQEGDDEFGDLAAMAATLLSIPGMFISHFQNPAYAKKNPIASTRSGPFPFRGNTPSIDLEDSIIAASAFLRDWFRHGFVPEAELVDAIKGAAGGDVNHIIDIDVEVLELDAPPAVARDSSSDSDDIIELKVSPAESCEVLIISDSEPDLSFGLMQGRKASEEI